MGRVPGEEFEVLQGLMELFAAEGAPYEEGEGPHLLTVTRARRKDSEEIA